MRHKHLRTPPIGNEPVACHGDSIYLRRILALRFLPFLKVDGAGKGRQHDELSEGEAGLLGEIVGGIKCVRSIGGQSEDERTKNVYAVLGKDAESLDQIVA